MRPQARTGSPNAVLRNDANQRLMAGCAPLGMRVNQIQRSEALPSHNPLQYLHLTSAQVRSEKLLSVSAATHHVMQLLLVKSPLTPRCTIRESSASAIVHLVGRHGRAIQFGFGSEARVRRALTE
jgi:hypothetical protein